MGTEWNPALRPPTCGHLVITAILRKLSHFPFLKTSLLWPYYLGPNLRRLSHFPFLKTSLLRLYYFGPNLRKLSHFPFLKDLVNTATLLIRSDFHIPTVAVLTGFQCNSNYKAFEIIKNNYRN